MDSQKPLLVFDLDETLIFASSSQLDLQAHFIYDEYYIYLRPYLNEALTKLSAHFDLAIWSSAGDLYVEHIVGRIVHECVTFQFVWGNSRCTLRFNPETASHFYLKNLKKVKRKGFSLRKTLIVDNTPLKVSANYGNAVYIQDFTGNSADDQLLKLTDFLISIKDRNDFKSIEKRFWNK